MRLLVIGADAAGMAAAHQSLRTARKAGRDLEVVALEATDHTSYSQCGIPYWVADDVTTGDGLVARSAEDHRRRGVDLRMRHEAVALDLDRRVADVRDHNAGRTLTLDFDEVLIATGAAPITPGWALADGAPLPGVLPMKTLDDGHVWREIAAGRPGHALVVGGGYIGVEAAEALARRGIRTTLLTRRSPMAATLVPEQGERVARGLEGLGVKVVRGAEIVGLERCDAGYELVTDTGDTHRGDVVVVALGVEPRTKLAVDAGLPVAGEREPYARRALVPDAGQRLADGVWAAGDCCAVEHVQLRQPCFLPLGTHANKAGRVAGTNIGGGSAQFPGSVGTAITRAGAVEISRAGLQPEWAPHLGLKVQQASLDATTASGYMPEAEPMHLWAMGDQASGRLLGLQITGGRGAAKRIDVAAAAMMMGLTCEQFAYLDLSYAPPFSSAWDPVQIVARKLAEGF